MPDFDAFDELQGDMAAHQRRTGAEATPEANRALLGPELEKVEKMLADVKPPSSPPPTQPALPTEKQIARKEVDGRSYLMSKQLDTPLVRVASKLEGEFIVRAEERLLMLVELADSGVLGSASWRDRVLAVMATKAKAASWKAAAEAPAELAATRATCEKDQALLKVLGLETISQLNPAFCRAKCAELEQKFLHEFVELLERSNTLFGDWKNPPDRPKVFGA